MFAFPFSMPPDLGYKIVNNAFSEIEFSIIKKAVSGQYVSNIRNHQYEDNGDITSNLSLEFPPIRYHEISDKFDHSKVWPKLSRVLGRDFHDWFLTTRFYKTMAAQFNITEITDEEKLGYGNIYWRIVRPFKDEDVGSLHRDSWFWEIDQSKYIPNYSFQRIKTWISLYVEQGLNGLLVFPCSHTMGDLKWRTKGKHGRLKPILTDPRVQREQALLLDTPANSAVIFHDDLVHGGAFNKGHYTRVSMEFTSIARSSINIHSFTP